MRLRLWTDEEINEAMNLFNSGFSASKTAQILNEKGLRNDCEKITRNAIIGIWARNNDKKKPRQKKVLEVKKDAIKKTLVKEDTINLVVKKEPELLVEEKEEPELQNGSISITDLLPWQCRYPYGDASFNFCGQPIDFDLGRSYCREHYRLCYYVRTKNQ